MATSFHQWATDAYSHVLVLGQQHQQQQQQQQPPPIPNISAHYIWFARQAGLPVVSHFCHLPSSSSSSSSSDPEPSPKGGQSAYERGLVALAYSILRQFIELAPPLLDCCLGGHLESLDLATGTVSSWEKVLSAIDTIMHFMPPVLVWMIDRLDVIHHPSTDDHIRSLLRILFRHASYPHVIPMYDGTTKSVLFKGLITVAGGPSMGWLKPALIETQRFSTTTTTSSSKDRQVGLDEVLQSELWAVEMST